MNYSQIYDRLLEATEADVKEFILLHLGETAWDDYKKDVNALEALAMEASWTKEQKLKIKASYIERLFQHKEIRLNHKRTMEERTKLPHNKN